MSSRPFLRTVTLRRFTSLSAVTLAAALISGCGGSDEPPAQSAAESQADSVINSSQDEPVVDVASRTEELVNAAVVMIGEQKFGESLQKLNGA